MRGVLCFAVLLLVAVTGVVAQQTIVSDVGRGGWEAWPDVCRLLNGELLCVFIAGPEDGTRAIFSIRSQDDGRTWSAPGVLLDTAHQEQEANITQLSDGRVVIAYWNMDGSDVYLLWSSDGGYTWSLPERQKLPHMPAPWGDALYASDPIRELDDGSLVIAVYGRHSTRSYYFSSGASRSTNGGRTWTTVAIPNPSESWWPEPGLAQMPDNALWLFVRPTMLRSVSTSRGRSWGAATSINHDGQDYIEGHAPYLMFTSAGAGILGLRRPQFRLFHDERTTWCPQANCTMDGGASWSDFIGIDTDCALGAYTSLVELPGDRVLCLYYVDSFTDTGSSADIRQAILHAGYGGMHLVAPAAYPHEFSAGWQMTGTPSTTALPEMEAAVRAGSALRWAPGSSAYAAYRGDFVRGRGLWVYRDAPEYFSSTPVVSAAAVRVGLSAGWNLISPPTTAAVPWDSGHVRTDGEAAIASYAYTWNPRDGRYDLLTPSAEGSSAGHQFLPWRGYFVYSSGPGGLRLVPGATRPLAPPRRDRPTLPAGTTDGAAWTLRFALSVDGVACGSTQVGAGSTPRGVLAPPPPPGATGSIGAGGAAAPPSLYELKGPEAQTWLVRVRANRAGACRLSWGFTKAPAGATPLTLSLDGASRTVNVGERWVWGWKATGPGEKVFRLRLGAAAPLSLRASAAGTAAGFAVTCTASTPATVTLTLRNLAGRPVSVPLQRELAAGTQEVLLPARTPGGAALPAGRYLCEVVARTATGAQASALCTVQRP